MPGLIAGGGCLARARVSVHAAPASRLKVVSPRTELAPPMSLTPIGSTTNVAIEALDWHVAGVVDRTMGATAESSGCNGGVDL